MKRIYEGKQFLMQDMGRDRSKEVLTLYYFFLLECAELYSKSSSFVKASEILSFIQSSVQQNEQDLEVIKYLYKTYLQRQGYKAIELRAMFLGLGGMKVNLLDPERRQFMDVLVLTKSFEKEILKKEKDIKLMQKFLGYTEYYHYFDMLQEKTEELEKLNEDEFLDDVDYIRALSRSVKAIKDFSADLKCKLGFVEILHYILELYPVIDNRLKNIVKKVIIDLDQDEVVVFNNLIITNKNGVINLNGEELLPYEYLIKRYKLTNEDMLIQISQYKKQMKKQDGFTSYIVKFTHIDIFTEIIKILKDLKKQSQIVPTSIFTRIVKKFALKDTGVSLKDFGKMLICA